MAYNNSDILAVLENHPHGGGEAYTEAEGKLHPSDADTSVSSVSGLQSAVNSSSDIIHIEDGTYNMTGTQMEIGNKTLVGSRGWNGSDGPLIYTNNGGPSSPYRFVRIFHSSNGGCRLTGLRLRGNDPYEELTHGGDPEAELCNAIKIRGPNGEVDNCEMWGFPWCDVHLRGGSSRATAEVHHNYFRKSLQQGYGYGVNLWADSYGDLHHNYFNNLRHCINGRGNHNIDYDVRDNVFGPDQHNHMVDMHCLTENSISSSSNPNSEYYHLRAGGAMLVERNTFCTDTTNAVGLRGYPWDYMHIYRNRFVHESRPPENPNSGGSDVWYARNMNWSGVSSYPPRDSEGYPANWDDANNQFDSLNNEWTTEAGASVNLQGETPTPTAPLGVWAEDDATGERIDGAEVYVEWLDADDAHPDDDVGPHTGITQPDVGSGGGYEFGDLPIGYYHIEVTADGYEMGTYDESLWRDSGEVDRQAMYLNESGRSPIIYLQPSDMETGDLSLTITTTDAEDGSDVDGANVNIWSN